MLVEETGERYVEVEIHRLQGNLLLARNGSAEAEACYVRALEVARGRKRRARSNCAPPANLPASGPGAATVHGQRIFSHWSTAGSPKGFDTADLKKANALLDSLD